MDSSDTDFLESLLIFKNTFNRELIRSVHLLRLEEGKEDEVEREFVFSENGAYVEMVAEPLLRLQKNFRVSEVFEGHVNGLWVCIFAFHTHNPPHISSIPSELSVSSNPKLKAIPSLAHDLELISRSCRISDDEEPSEVLTEESCEGNNGICHELKRSLVLHQDLNCPPHPTSMSESSEEVLQVERSSGVVDKKKKRATRRDISRITLSDVTMYFDVPIKQASMHLKVGLTALKRRCREFGIRRWPHRKIRSLDNLINELQVESKNQQLGDKAAAVALAKRQKMLEIERAIIERKPFLEMKAETRKFRQDVYKRRHRAKALNSTSNS
ncbi:hypothetical protein UlMin_039638 [Ulmus minor]